MKYKIIIKPLGDSALIVQLGDGVDPLIHERAQNLTDLLNLHQFNGFIEAVPAYNNVTVYYNPFIVYQTSYKTGKTSFQKVSAYINELIMRSPHKNHSKENIVKIPVLYGGEEGPDLEYVANYHNLTPEEVIHIHSSQDYLVYMLGFAPGFPFLGGVDPRVATPRKETPRQAIAPGSVGIAGEQTGVYPLETPGGWQIIGRTPRKLFLPEQSPPTLLQPGDKIRFVPITNERYELYKEGV